MTALSPDQTILFVSSLDNSDANHRLWFQAVPEALGGSAVSLGPDQLSGRVRGRRGRIDLLCSYKDGRAYHAINSLPPEERDRLVIGVIASDIYDLDHYLRWGRTPSFFLAPTPEHESLLRSVLTHRIFTVAEPLDPLAVSPSAATDPEFDGRITWFGYPESFDKGMRHLLPAIHRAVDAGDIEGLTVMTSEVLPDLPAWVRQLPYSDEALPEMLSAASFVLLSHFSYDLHANSAIKTDNKALLSLAHGAIPVASDTPSYGRVLRGVGLEHYLFDGPAALRQILSNLSADRVALTETQRLLVGDLLQQRSALNTAARVQAVFAAI